MVTTEELLEEEFLRGHCWLCCEPIPYGVYCALCGYYECESQLEEQEIMYSYENKTLEEIPIQIEHDLVILYNRLEEGLKSEIEHKTGVEMIFLKIKVEDMLNIMRDKLVEQVCPFCNRQPFEKEIEENHDRQT